MTSSTRSDQEKIATVTAKLKGEQFFPRQTVRWRRVGSGSEKNMLGRVLHVFEDTLHVTYVGRDGLVIEIVSYHNAEPA